MSMVCADADVGPNGNACFCIRLLAGWRAVANPSEHGGRPSGDPGGRGGGIPVVRALLVLVLFVVVTVLVLSEIHPTTTKAVSGSASVSTTTTTRSHPAHHSTTTTTTTTPPSKVHVLVANASGVNGAAAAVSAQLKPAGWALLPPTNASAVVTASHVYYVAGFKPEADAIASSLQLPATSVGPYTTAAPISSIGTAEVAVVVGPDLADKTSASSTPS